jgi:hypothetical protein
MSTNFESTNFDLEPVGIRCRVGKRVAVKASTAVASAAAAEVEGTVSLCS